MVGALFIRAVIYFFMALLLPLSLSFADEKRLQILVTNDDGYHSKGIRVLTEQLGTIGDVLTVAPVTDQSGASQSTTVLKGETWVIPHREGGKLVGYEVEGTPADAVRFGIMSLGKKTKFDLVVSGINKGGNVGDINLYSGTVGAAMEARLHGIPALAVSQSSRRKDDFALSAWLALKLVKQMIQKGVPNNVVLSLNVPSGVVRGVKVTPVKGLVLQVKGFKRGENVGARTKYIPILRFERTQPLGSDSEAYIQKYATVTPISVDRTAYEVLPVLNLWDLSLPKTKKAPRKEK